MAAGAVAAPGAKRSRLAITVAVLIQALAILVRLAYGFTREPRYIESPMLGRTAPWFALTLFDGRTVRLEDFRGRVVFVNFCACPPCRAEAPVLERLWCDLKDQEVVFVGINTQHEEPKARDRRRVRSHLSKRPRSAGRIAIDYGVWSLPEAFVVDPARRITYKHIGTLGPSVLVAKIDEARRGTVSTTQGRGDYQSTR